jgi:hypothetical protein
MSDHEHSEPKTIEEWETGYFEIKRIIKPWIAVGHRGEVYQFDTRQEAADFVRAEYEAMAEPEAEHEGSA